VRVANIVHAAGASDPGLQRHRNEDRCHWDERRGIFIVIDGVGGQAAGEKAADTAIARVRDRLERQTGRTEDRIREAISIANDEIFRLASIRPEWKGMACVLTVAVVDNGDVVVGHVGDTRLYKIRGGRLQKITRDHSPVGEREDARELSERQAMQHPRRNEVFRDVGSEPHEPDDPDFIDIARVPFERDAALLLCSDGLTDAIDSAAIGRIVQTFAGHPRDVVRELIEAANDAGGKDNVTAVYVEGEQFAGRHAREWPNDIVQAPLPAVSADAADETPRMNVAPASPTSQSARSSRTKWWVRLALVFLILLVVGAAIGLETPYGRKLLRLPISSAVGAARQITVAPGESIARALEDASPGTEILVEPGEYREAIALPEGVRLVSRVPRQAILRLSGGAADNAAVVTASHVKDAHFIGFRIVGDAATPMGTGIYANQATIEIVDVEISGAKNAAVEFDSAAAGALLASDLIDNFGSALVVRAGATPRIGHNRFARNATAETSIAWLIVDSNATPRFDGNTFDGLRPDSFPHLKDRNWFIAPPAPVPPEPRRGRK
jgi:serine/threonine protein phosphatase PrpC